MRYLLQGTESPERLTMILWFSSIRSEGITEGLHWHLVTGHHIEAAAALAQIKPSNLIRALDVLNEIAEKYERLKEYDLLKVRK